MSWQEEIKQIYEIKYGWVKERERTDLKAPTLTVLPDNTDKFSQEKLAQELKISQPKLSQDLQLAQKIE